MNETGTSGTAPPLLLTVPEVAEVLRTTAKGVYAMVERGQLPGVVRIGRRVLLRRDRLLKWLTELSDDRGRGRRATDQA
jgi:excisionase family DNA binding protein